MTNSSIYKKLFSFAIPYLARIFLSLIFMLLLAITTALYPQLLGEMIKYLFLGGKTLTNDSLSFLSEYSDNLVFPAWLKNNMLPFLVIIIVIIKAFSQFGKFWILGDIGQRIIRDMRSELFRHTLYFRQSYFDHHSTGSLVNYFINDISQIEYLITFAYPNIIADGLKIIALIISCIYIDSELSFVSFVILPIALVPIVHFGKKLKKVSGESQHSMGIISSFLYEIFSGIKTVHLFHREKYEQQQFLHRIETYRQIMHRSFIVRAAQTPVMELIGVVGMAFTIMYAATRVSQQSLQPESFVSFFTALLMLYEPLKGIGRVNNFVQPGLSAAERIFTLMEFSTEKEHDGQFTFPDDYHGISFQNVTFTYENAHREKDTKPALHNISCIIPINKTTALVGESGSGKSTFVQLLPRLYIPNSGIITIDNRDIQSMTLSSLREHIAFVSQDPFLFHASIADNIQYGATQHVTFNEVKEACKNAYAHDFIMQFPQQYDTIVGERGVMLSGGQRQRIAIARAFLKNAPILILDEATSALDSQSEQFVQKAIDNLMKGKTCIVIAHRLSTIINADQILVFSHGEIIEQGNHQSLLQNNGIYKQLFDIQFQTMHNSLV